MGMCVHQAGHQQAIRCVDDGGRLGSGQIGRADFDDALILDQDVTGGCAVGACIQNPAAADDGVSHSFAPLNAAPQSS